MSKCSLFTRLAVAACCAVSAAGSASAQVAANPDYYIKGSDTWFEVMTDAINQAKAEGALPTASPTLIYDGTGSGNASTSMGATTNPGGQTNPLGTQSIGPMSRNFRPTELTRFPTWTPQLENIGGLDAAVIIRSDLASCVNFNLPLLLTDATKANPNNKDLPWTGFVAGSGYDQLLEVILSGVDGSGSVAACANPRRTQAILDFAACNGVSNMNHFYRRDDNSGTTDTFKDKVAVNRFCNGAAIGALVARADGQFNLNNQDHDPIRRPCDVSSPTRSKTTCTDLTTGLICDSAAPSCTQGLIVAVTIGDLGYPDATQTIGNRIRTDPTGQTFGFAGREAARLAGGGAAGVFINTNPPSDTLVRGDNYLLARRLFLQRGPAVPALDGIAFVAGQPAPTLQSGTNLRLCNGVLTPSGGCNERPNLLAQSAQFCPSGTSNLCTGGGTTQRDLEDRLFSWMTNPDNTFGLGLPGRCNVDPIFTARGYLSCTDNCIDPPSGPENLCSKSPYPPVPSTPSACAPTTTPNVAGTNLWNGSATVACSGTAICCSNGLACNVLPNTGTACAAAIGRAVNVACSRDGIQAECAAGLTCTDVGAGTLVCQ